MVRGDYTPKWFERKNRLKNTFLNYHRLENYLKVNGTDNAIIEYDGDAYSIKYEKGSLTINEKISGPVYPLPQIMYVPAERNFITYVKTPKELKLASPSLIEFLTEFDHAKYDMKGLVQLPINNVNVEYDRLNDTLNLKGEDYKIRLTEASSGFQSLVPLYLVSDYLAKSVKKQSENKEPMSSEERERFRKRVAEILSNESLTEEQRRIALSVLSSKFNKTAFVNIVEEPEQNLFPSSQWNVLKSLLAFNNMNSSNKLIMTTHSPYIVNFLSIAAQGNYLKNKIDSSSKTNELLPQLNTIIPEKALVSIEDIAVYQLDEREGNIKKLSAPEGIPSNNNYLNNMLREGNHVFDSLLEIEELL